MEKFRLFVITLFGVGLVISISLAQASCAVLFLFWLIALARNPSWKKTTLDIPIFILFLWGILVGIMSPTASMSDAFWPVNALGLYYLAAHYFSDSDRNVTLRWMCYGAVVSGIWACIQVASGVNYRPNENMFFIPEHWNIPQWLGRSLAVYNDRAVGFRGHAITFAESLIAPCLIVFSRIGESGRKRILFAMGFLFIGLGVLFAQSRGVWLALFIGAAVYSLMSPNRFYRRAFLLVMIIGTPLLFTFSPQLRGRVLSMVSTTSGTPSDQHSKQVRMNLWKASWEAIKAKPVIGGGLKGAKLEVIDPITQASRTWSESHNVFIQYAVDLGLIGFGLILWIFILIAALILKKNQWMRPLSMALFVAFIVAGFTESWTSDKEIAMIFWFLVGCLDKKDSLEKA